MQVSQTETTKVNPGATVSKDKIKELKSLLPPLPRSITLEYREPPAPNNFYRCLCICYSDGYFIAEFPTTLKMGRNEFLTLIGYYYHGHRSGVYKYTKYSKNALPAVTIEEYHREISEVLF